LTLPFCFYLFFPTLIRDFLCPSPHCSYPCFFPRCFREPKICCVLFKPPTQFFFFHPPLIGPRVNTHPKLRFRISVPPPHPAPNYPLFRKPFPGPFVPSAGSGNNPPVPCSATDPLQPLVLGMFFLPDSEHTSCGFFFFLLKAPPVPHTLPFGSSRGCLLLRTFLCFPQLFS